MTIKMQLLHCADFGTCDLTFAMKLSKLDLVRHGHVTARFGCTALRVLVAGLNVNTLQPTYFDLDCLLTASDCIQTII